MADGKKLNNAGQVLKTFQSEDLKMAVPCTTTQLRSQIEQLASAADLPGENREMVHQ
jgi:hypothetical protein